jgi:endonuclease III
MLPLFPHDDAQRAQEILERIKPLADAFWQEADPPRLRHDPFAVLVVSLLSPRTQTEASRAAMEELFSLADKPATMAQLPYEQVAAILQKHDIRFPEDKARHLLETSAMMTENGGEVPRTMEALMKFPGLGWKTSLLTLHLAYNLAPEICVDVHVARITQRLGFVNPKTENPQKVSKELMAIVPREWWLEVNSCLVYFGKTRCYFDKPACKGCPVFDLCERVGVTSSVK